MKARTAVGVLMMVGIGLVTVVAQQSDRARPLAHVRHNDIHFAVSIDPDDSKCLAIMVPTREQTHQAIGVKLRFRDETSVEGLAQAGISISSGGFTDWRYRFDAKRTVTIRDIFSVTISLAGESSRSSRGNFKRATTRRFSTTPVKTGRLSTNGGADDQERRNHEVYR